MVPYTDQNFSIGINDIDEFDVGSVSDSDATANQVLENAANGTVVGITTLATDNDATTNAISYTLDDSAGGRFAIDINTGVITVADGTLLDYESSTSHSITVRATSADGPSKRKTTPSKSWMEMRVASPVSPIPIQLPIPFWKTHRSGPL